MSDHPNCRCALIEYRRVVEPHYAAMKMVRETIEFLFGPQANLISEEAVLGVYGPEPVHEAQAIVDALMRIKHGN